MSLSLTVTSYKGQAPLQSMAITFDRQGGRIGRSTDNDWVLPDPDKYVSSHHATIEYRSETYYITDTSSNGVFILPSEVSLGRNDSIGLRDGDQLGIGEYQVEVSVTADEFLSPGHAAASSRKIQNNQGFEQDPFMDLGADPIANLIVDTDALDDDFSSPEESVNFEFFATPSPSAPDKHIATDSDHVPALDEAFSPARGAEAAYVPAFSETSETPVEDAQSSFLPENWFANEVPSPPPIERPAKASLTTKSRPAGKPPSTTTAHSTSPQTSSATRVEGLPTESEQEIIQRFCEGAGIHDELAQQLTPESFYSIGKMLRITVQGAMEVLLARTRIKNEMRLDVTTLRSEENNPIKFSIDVDEVLTHLLANQEHRGYMEPVQALEESFNDIKAHQLAVIAGMHSVLKRFDPQRLESRLQRQSPVSASIPIHRQAKLWSQFEQLYEDIEIEAQDDFNRLFGQAFARAYAEQVHQLKAGPTPDSEG